MEITSKPEVITFSRFDVVFYQDGKETANLIYADRPWSIKINWSLQGPSAPYIRGTWRLNLWTEPIDPDLERIVFPSAPPLPLDPGEDGDYEYIFDIPPGIVKLKHTSTLYKLIVVIACLTPRGVQFIGFEEEFLPPFVMTDAGDEHTHFLEKSERLEKPRKIQVEQTQDELLEDYIATIIFDTDQNLTPSYLRSDILPYLKATIEIQRIIDEIEGKPHRVRIRAITQNSPVTATVEGIAKATQIIAELVIPWRRNHAQKLANIEERTKLAAIEKMKAEVLEVRARAAKDRTAKDKLLAEIEKQYAEAEKMRLENEKVKLELAEAKMNLALKFLERVNPNLSEKERIAYTTRLLPLLETIISSPLEISIIEQDSDDDTPTNLDSAQ